MLLSRLLCLALLTLLSFAPATAQNEGTPPDNTARTFRVGLIEKPPYAMRDRDGAWSGMAIELWRHLAEQEQLSYEYQLFEDPEDVQRAVDAGEVDLSITASLHEKRTDDVRYLQNHYRTTLGVASKNQNNMVSVLKGVFTMRFLWIVVSLSILLLLVGTIIYFVERDENDEQFGGDRNILEGIGSGFWWSGVTLTTIGYGDKAPITLGGRIVAMLWMLVAIAVSASLTASVVSALNKQDDLNFPEDLKGEPVGVLDGSAAAEYLEAEGYSFQPVASLRDGLKSVQDGDLRAVVSDATSLRHVNNQLDNAVGVTTTDARPVEYAIAIRRDNALADRLDAALVQFILGGTWPGVVQEYGGKDKKKK